jgi:hypothetical protein
MYSPMHGIHHRVLLQIQSTLSPITPKRMQIEEEKTNLFTGFLNSDVLCRVGLAQLVRFLVVELIHSDSNSKFNICVVFTANYSFSGKSMRVCVHRSEYGRGALVDRLHES